MPETKRVLWVDEQAAVLLTNLRALVSELCTKSGVDLCLDFTLADNVEE